MYDSFLQTLERATLNRCSRWAEKTRVLNNQPPLKGPWTFTYHPWLLAPHDDSNEEIVVKKAAQMGFTEWALNRTLYSLDKLERNVLYVLPSERPDANRFSKGRINSVQKACPKLAGFFSGSHGEFHKVTYNDRNLYICGAKSRSPLKNVDVSLVVLDEIDEIGEEFVELAHDRLDGQPAGHKQLIMLSTPSVEGMGVDKIFADSTQQFMFFKCPHCSKSTQLIYPDCLIITSDDPLDPKIKDSHLICKECQHKLDHETKHEWLKNHEWVARTPGKIIQGYHVSQLYSCMMEPWRLARRAVKGRYNLAANTEFYNSNLGETFLAPNAKITEANITDCRREFKNNDINQVSKFQFVTLGCDIGQKIHYISVVGWNMMPGNKHIYHAGHGRLLYHGTVEGFDGIDKALNYWCPTKAVIDAQPSLQEVLKICRRYPPVFACYYKDSKKQDNQITLGTKDGIKQTITVSRSFWLDILMSKVHMQALEFPLDLEPEYRLHLQSVSKVYKFDDKGNVYADFVKRESDADHYLHSTNYAIIALGLMAGSGNAVED